MRCQISNPSQLCARQIASPLYYHSSHWNFLSRTGKKERDSWEENSQENSWEGGYYMRLSDSRSETQLGMDGQKNPTNPNKNRKIGPKRLRSHMEDHDLSSNLNSSPAESNWEQLKSANSWRRKSISATEILRLSGQKTDLRKLYAHLQLSPCPCVCSPLVDSDFFKITISQVIWFPMNPPPNSDTLSFNMIVTVQEVHALA